MNGQNRNRANKVDMNIYEVKWMNCGNMLKTRVIANNWQDLLNILFNYYDSKASIYINHSDILSMKLVDCEDD